jgi:pimeloyl-ACP methyl ester carboxylesterase
MRDTTFTVVLVHGGWHGAWCWERVVDRLSASGVRALAVDLPGHGADVGALGDLHSDADRVRDVLDTSDATCVLVGHSYGGAVITEAGDHGAVTHLLYLCAMALDETETCAGAAVAGAAAAAASQEDVPDLAAGFISDGRGSVALDPLVAAACMYGDCDPATVNWALARLGPQPVASLRQAPRTVAWRSKPSTYVVCTHDLVIPPGLQRVFAQRCTMSTEWDSGHSPFLSQPDRVADLVRHIASLQPGNEPRDHGGLLECPEAE